jgi:hypothetical protein
MIIAKGYAVSFEMKDGSDVDAPRSAAMLHDEKGKHWPKCSMLIMPFRKGGAAVEMTGDEADYFGGDYDARQGSVTLPPKPLSEWTCLGEVHKIFYERPGKHRGLFKHEFGKRRLVGLFKTGKATLYKRGSALRLELGKSCIADARGIVRP